MSRELDAKVERARGKRIGKPDGTYGYVPGNPSVVALPHYSTDIAAAWMLVEEMVREGYNPRISHIHKGWVCKIVLWQEEIVEKADTVCEAICKAYLIWKKVI